MRVATETKTPIFSFQRIRALGSSNTNNTGLVIPQNKNATKSGCRVLLHNE